ncbi:MAG: tetratricopeptide repeat protein, partial [Nitrospira sp.]|nr:tetratricopeptide repeat protein [Nitrospira sp.]
ELSKAIKIFKSHDEPTTTFTRLKEWFGAQTAPWLLVYDNAKGPEGLTAYLPQLGPHHIIVTSRQTGGWGGLGSSLKVRPLSREESVRFLLARSGSGTSDGADRLADVLGDLPLALEQAAAYMDVVGLNFGAYLNRFETREADLLAHETLPTEYPTSVTTTFTLSFEQLQSDSPIAASLLKLLCFFAPDAIFDTWVKEGAGSLPGPLAETVVDELAFDKVLTALRKQSLIQISDGKWTLHRLTQKVMRYWLGKESKEWAEIAVHFLRASFEQHPPDPMARAYEQYCMPHPGPRHERGALLSHAIVSAEIARTYDVGLEAVAYLYREISHVLQFGLRENESAVQFSKRAYELCKNIYGPRSQNVALAAHNVCRILQGQQKFDEALEFANQSLELDEEIYGPEHYEVTKDVFVIGQIMASKGDEHGELANMRRVLDIYEKIYGAHHSAVAWAVRQVANTRSLRGTPEALNYLQRALEIDERAFGPESPDVAEALHEIGHRRFSHGDRARGLEEMQRGLTIEETIYGPESFQVANRNHDIALALYIENPDLALKYAQRAVDLLQKNNQSEVPPLAIFRDMYLQLVKVIKSYRNRPQTLMTGSDSRD